jgi:hypothetical protein
MPQLEQFEEGKVNQLHTVVMEEFSMKIKASDINKRQIRETNGNDITINGIKIVLGEGLDPNTKITKAEITIHRQPSINLGKTLRLKHNKIKKENIED